MVERRTYTPDSSRLERGEGSIPSGSTKSSNCRASFWSDSATIRQLCAQGSTEFSVAAAVGPNRNVQTFCGRHCALTMPGRGDDEFQYEFEYGFENFLG